VNPRRNNKRPRLDSLNEEGVRHLGLERSNTSFAGSGMFMFAIIIGMICCSVSLLRGEGPMNVAEFGRELMCSSMDAQDGYLLNNEVDEPELLDDELVLTGTE